MIDEDPRRFDKSLKHELKGLWCYRIGDYRAICQIQDEQLVVLVLVVGIEVKNSMKKKIKYTDLPPGNEPIGELEIIKDFFPPPGELVLKEDNVEVTISLSRSSIKYFKQQAKKHHTQYQKMIRNLLDEYVGQHNK